MASCSQCGGKFGLIRHYLLTLHGCLCFCSQKCVQRFKDDRDRKIAQIIPQQFSRGATPYARLLGATDYISGMTDGFALTLFRRLHGIELPGTIV